MSTPMSFGSQFAFPEGSTCTGCGSLRTLHGELWRCANCGGEEAAVVAENATAAPPPPTRRHLPIERNAVTHRFVVGGHKGYITVGLYEDGAPGELFINTGKAGSTVKGFADAAAILASLLLQHGVALKVIANRFVGARFEPSGPTTNNKIPVATSMLDYVFRWMLARFPAAEVGA